MVRVEVRKERVWTTVDVRFLLWISMYVLLLVGGSAALPGYAAIDYHAYPKYSFKYGVSDAYTGDVKQHSEHREGDVVKGQYSLVEPDGSVRQVEYTADPVNGFNAVVLKSQPNVHPPAVKPVAVAAPAVAVQKPIAVAVAAAPLKYFPSPSVHYGHEQIAAVPLGGHPYTYPYPSDHGPYSAYLHPRHYDYEQY